MFGATGVIGQALLPLLIGEHDVAAVSRNPHEPADGIRWVRADAATGSGVAEAVDGADIVYYLVHSLGTPDFARQDQTAAAKVAGCAAPAGVKQIVYLGGLGEDEPSTSPHLRSRRETGQRLAAEGVPVTTLRAAMVIGAGSAAFETIVGLVKRLPVMITPSWVSTPTQPIALEDVARYLAGVAGNPATGGQTFDAGGPEVMTYRQMIERIAVLLGRKPRIVEVPVLTPALSALWLELVTPVNSAVARPLVEGLRAMPIRKGEGVLGMMAVLLRSHASDRGATGTGATLAGSGATRSLGDEADPERASQSGREGQHLLQPHRGAAQALDPLDVVHPAPAELGPRELGVAETRPAQVAVVEPKPVSAQAREVRLAQDAVLEGDPFEPGVPERRHVGAARPPDAVADLGLDDLESRQPPALHEQTGERATAERRVRELRMLEDRVPNHSVDEHRSREVGVA